MSPTSYTQADYERQKRWRQAHPERYRRYTKAMNLKRHGLTISEYEEMVRARGGKCDICGSPQSVTFRPYADQQPRSDGLCVDHDHDTGRIRGLLCHRCNRAIGLLKDDPLLLQKAADYLA